MDYNGGHEISTSNETRSETGAVIIGDDVWIGHDVSILPGVEIGDGAIVAAKTLVNKDVPEKSLAAGIPAEIIETDVSWE